MEKWKEIKASAILDSIKNGTSDKQVSYITDYPVTRIETISEAKFDFNKIGYVEICPETYLLRNGDILLSNINSLKHIGKLAFYENEKKLYHGMNLLLLRFKDEYDKKFLFYYLIQKKSWFEKMAAQAINQASINQTTIGDLVLCLPASKPEQTQIATILSTAVAAIEQTEKLIAKYQRIKTGLMQDLLTKGIDTKGNIRSKATHKFVVKNGIEVPEEWEVLSLEYTCKKITDGAHFSPKPQEDGRLIGNVKDMEENGFNLMSCTSILESDFQSLKQQNCCPEKGDVLLSKDGTIGRVIFFNLDLEMVILSSIAILRPKDDYEGIYLSYLLKSEYFSKQLIALESGSALRRIILKDIKSLKFPFPNNKSEQFEISNRLKKTDDLIENENKYLNKLHSLKTGLMQDLLSGRVRVNKTA